MQLFPCPFCGPREESEFHYGGEAGNLRPDGGDVTAERWAGYLHMR
ncbi:sarcosine oxidase subunit delta, partial [Mesorhizobium sp.]